MKNSPTLEKVKQVSVFEQALLQIRNAILNDQYKQGDKLPTVIELGDALDISHVTVRQVLSVLEAEGLVESRRGSGVFVSPSSTWKLMQGNLLRFFAQRNETVLELLQIRESLECMNVSIVAETASDETIAALQAIIEDQQAAVAEDASVEELAELDMKFHLTISAASGNSFSHEIVSHIAPAFSESRREMLWVKPYVYDAIQDHIMILNFIKTKDSMGAEKAMNNHIARVRQLVSGSLR